MLSFQFDYEIIFVPTLFIYKESIPIDPPLKHPIY